MKSFVVFCLSALVVVAMSAETGDLKDVDFKELLADDARRKEIYDCLMDQAPCGDYQAYRDLIPSIIETNCGECKPEEKEKYGELTKYILENYPEEFKAVAAKYSPKSAE